MLQMSFFWVFLWTTKSFLESEPPACGAGLSVLESLGRQVPDLVACQSVQPSM